MNHDPILHLLGLARKAGRLELGEEPVGAACRAHQAKLILLADDAAANTRRRAAHFGQAGNVLWLDLPFPKEDLGLLFGRTSCAMLALTDFGFAASVVEKLAAREPERYAPAAQQLREKADKVIQRQREQRQHEKNLKQGKHKPWAAPTAPAKDASAPRPPRQEKPKPPSQGPSASPPKGGPSRGMHKPGAAPVSKSGSGAPHKPGPGGRRLSGSIPKKRGGFPL